MSHSASLNPIQVQQYQSQLHGLSPAISRLTYWAAYAPFKPSDPDNACTLRITAAAGTELAGAYSDGTLKPRARRGYCSHPKEVYNAERLRPSRGMAGSGFRPLSNIPYCCLP